LHTFAALPEARKNRAKLPASHLSEGIYESCSYDIFRRCCFGGSGTSGNWTFQADGTRFSFSGGKEIGGHVRTLLSPVIVALTLGTFCAAQAQTEAKPVEVTLIAPGGIKAAIEQLIPGFESKTGYKVKATFGSGLGTKKQVAQGERFDVPILQPPYPEVIASGNVNPRTGVVLASVAVGFAVRKGAKKPDISTLDAVRRTLLAAKSVSYPDAAAGAAAGVSFDDTLTRLGIAMQMQSKLKRAQGGAGAMAMVAKGDAELGVTFVSEMEDPGIDVVGTLPVGASTPTDLVAFISTHPGNAAAARALVDYLSSHEAASAYTAKHMQARH
jgi:molybdate transport system substrate-binding protein